MQVTVSTQDPSRETAGLIVLAVDDEPGGLKLLVERLNRNPHVRRIITAVDASEALRVLSSPEVELRTRREQGLPVVDVVFADLDMPGLSGMEMSRVFSTLTPPPLLVFVTGHQEEAVHAFDLGAVDYVLKPYPPDRLDKAIDRAREKIMRGKSMLLNSPSHPEIADDEVIPVELAGTTRLIPRSAVRWVEAQGDYARLYTAEGSHLVRTPLAQLQARWQQAGFVRVHRSFLVSLPLITELRMGQGGYQVVIGEGEKVLPVSRRHTRELKDRLVGSPRSS